MTRRYSELIQIQSFLERFEYLKLSGTVGKEIFGHERWMNQQFYNGPIWRPFRNRIIVRDYGRDMAMEGYDIKSDSVFIHHLNPITADDIRFMRRCVMDPENVVCVRFSTHQAIHYGDRNILLMNPVERKPFDTCPWRKQEGAV